MKDTTFERQMEKAGDLDPWKTLVVINGFCLFGHNWTLEGRQITIYHDFEPGDMIRISYENEIVLDHTISRKQFGVTLEL